MVTYDINIFFFKHFHQAVSCVCGVIKQHVAWLYPDCTVIAGHMQMLLYHGVLEKENSSCVPASSIFVTAVFWRLSFILAWHDPRMKGVTAGIAYWDSVYIAGLCCWITSIYWLYLTKWCSCFTFLNAKMLLVNLMQGARLLLVPEMWWKAHPQHEKLENPGGSDNGQAQVKAASGKGQSCAHKRGKNLGLMNLHKLTFGTPFPPGTLDTVTLTKCRQMLQFIVSSLN